VTCETGGISDDPIRAGALERGSPSGPDSYASVTSILSAFETVID